MWPGAAGCLATLGRYRILYEIAGDAVAIRHIARDTGN
jgi:hypothetical protein